MIVLDNTPRSHDALAVQMGEELAFIQTLTWIHGLSSNSRMLRSRLPQLQTTPEENFMAEQILQTLFSTDNEGICFEKTIQGIVGTRRWTESLATALLKGIENGLEQGAPMGKTMTEACDRAVAAASEFARDHPYFCALIAIGILAILMPWALQALGFTELGPVGGNINTY